MDDALRTALYSGAFGDVELALAPKGERLVALYAFLHGERTELPPASRAPSDIPLASAEQVALARIELVSLGGHPAKCEGAGDDAWSTAAQALGAYLRCQTMPPAPQELSTSPVLRLEQLALRSLGQMDEGDIHRAIMDARRVTRAAYAESIRLQEFFAYWVLARARRLDGHAHAAARISASLCRAAPATWRPLLDWELVLAGGDEESIGRPVEGPAALWLDLRRAVIEGKASRDEERAFRAQQLLPRFAKERDALCDGLGGHTDLETLRPLAGALSATASRLGLTPALWRLEGKSSSLLWCIASKNEPRIGFREGERIQRVLACLAAAYPASTSAEGLFEKVYGFELDSEDHKTMLRVLLHRVRGVLEGHGTIEREGAGFRLEVSASLLLPEPASAPPFGDQILRAIALRPGINAAALAEALGKNVRTVQRALKVLDVAGACVSTRVGRGTTYALEDTTFSEPTHFRSEAP